MLYEHTGYVWNGLVYCGKMDPPSGFDHAETVVLKLIKKTVRSWSCSLCGYFLQKRAFSESSTKSKNVDLGNIKEKQKTPTKKYCFYKTKKTTAHCNTKRAYCCRKVAR